MKQKPLATRLIVEEVKEEEKTAAGIILPDTAEGEKSSQGKVVALGNGKKIKVLNLKIGDKVIYSYGKEVKIDKKEYLILDSDEVLAIIE